MSVTEPSAEPVQPDAGQGGEGTGGGSPWADLLVRIPEESRGEFETRFKEWDGNYTRHQQEASEYRKAWEPYEQAGVSQYSPEDIQAAFQLLNDPAQARAWLDQQYGAPQAPAEPAAPPQFADEFGAFNPDALEQVLSQKLGPLEQQLQQFAQWQQRQEEQQRVQEAQQFIEGQLHELEQKHPDDFKDSGPYGARRMVERLIAEYIDSDPVNAVSRAFADYQALTAQIEKATLQAKASDPAPPETGGVVNGAPEEITSMEQASRIALERLRGMRQA